MKKNLTGAIVVLLVVVLIGAYFLFVMDRSPEGEIPQSELIQKVFPVMVSYCQDLQSNVTHSACPTCRSPGMSECEFVSEEEFESIYKYGGDVCLFKKTNEGYSLSVRRNIIHGYNTRSSSVDFDFILDEEGNILSQELEEISCM